MTERLHRLYLHIGAGKTATTAIQSSIPLLRRDLEANGIYAPLDPEIDEILKYRPRVASGYSFTIAKLLNPGFRRHGPFDEAQAWEWLAEEVRKAEANKHDLLFSSEALQYAHSNQLAKLASLISSHSWTPCIIFYIRDGIDYTISEYLQHLKTGFISYPQRQVPYSLSDYVSTAEIPFLKTYETYSKTFGSTSMTIKNFDKIKKFLLKDFLSVLTPKNIDIPDIRRFNRSLSRNEQEALEQILRLPNGAEICRAIGGRIVNQAMKRGDSTLYYITEQSIERYKEKNQPVVTQLNSYISPDCHIQLIGERSPLSKAVEKAYMPDWHRTYSDFILALHSLYHS